MGDFKNEGQPNRDLIGEITAVTSGLGNTITADEIEEFESGEDELEIQPRSGAPEISSRVQSLIAMLSKKYGDDFSHHAEECCFKCRFCSKSKFIYDIHTNNGGRISARLTQHLRSRSHIRARQAISSSFENPILGSEVNQSSTGRMETPFGTGNTPLSAPIGPLSDTDASSQYVSLVAEPVMRPFMYVHTQQTLSSLNQPSHVQNVGRYPIPVSLFSNFGADIFLGQLNALLRRQTMSKNTSIAVYDGNHHLTESVRVGALILRYIVPYNPPGTINLIMLHSNSSKAEYSSLLVVFSELFNQFFVMPNNGLYPAFLAASAGFLTGDGDSNGDMRFHPVFFVIKRQNFDSAIETLERLNMATTYCGPSFITPPSRTVNDLIPQMSASIANILWEQDYSTDLEFIQHIGPMIIHHLAKEFGVPFSQKEDMIYDQTFFFSIPSVADPIVSVGVMEFTREGNILLLASQSVLSGTKSGYLDIPQMEKGRSYRVFIPKGALNGAQMTEETCVAISAVFVTPEYRLDVNNFAISFSHLGILELWHPRGVSEELSRLKVDLDALVRQAVVIDYGSLN